MGNVRRVLMVANSDWIFYAHRMKIARALLEQGIEVFCVTRFQEAGLKEKIEKEGVKCLHININRSGTNLIVEILSLLQLLFLYLRYKPNIVYHVTMKPMIYGSVISRILNIKTINTVSGLGYTFTDNRKGVIQKLMLRLMKFGFDRSNCSVFFENRDDYNELFELKVIKKESPVKVYFVKGVGVDLDLYSPVKKIDTTCIVLMPSRILIDKGVKEFVSAAKELKRIYQNEVKFWIYGKLDFENKGSLSKDYIDNACAKGYIEWKGYSNQMYKIYPKVNLVVLPSYREGMPTVLLEACATGLPLITTDTNGCRDCVNDGENGYLVPVKSVKLLIEKIQYLIENDKLREKMGVKSREKAVREFDEKKVIKSYMNVFCQ